MNEINIPLSGTGSQPVEGDDAMLDSQQLPDQVPNFDSAMSALTKLDCVLQDLVGVKDIKPEIVDITHLDGENRSLVDLVLGEGEVSMVFHCDHTSARVQESVMAGVWRIRYFDRQGEPISDNIEVAPVPRLCKRHVFKRASHRVDTQLESMPEGVLNAPPLLAEINDKVAEYRPGKSSHVINLTQLPQTEQDLSFLGDRLGAGPLTIHTRGYGDYRITSTAVQNVWWVRYFNSQDESVHNTLEIGDVPQVVAAASEDIQASAQRLSEIMEAYR